MKHGSVEHGLLLHLAGIAPDEEPHRVEIRMSDLARAMRLSETEAAHALERLRRIGHLHARPLTVEVELLPMRPYTPPPPEVDTRRSQPEEETEE